MASEKRNIFQGITFPQRPILYNLLLPLKRKRKIYQYFVHGTALRRMRKEKKNTPIYREIFPEIFV